MKKVLFLLLGYALFNFGFIPTLAQSNSKIVKYIQNGSYLLKDGNDLIGYKANQAFIPASTIKILTSLLALETLGADFRYETPFYLDKENNLYIKGLGDPYLTSEVILNIGLKLAEQGLREIQTIYLDDTAFKLDNSLMTPGRTTNPYDAPNGSLAVNFNALPLEITEKGVITSGEKQTPVLPMMKFAAKNLKAGKYRININTIPGKNDLSPALCYVGELFAAQFTRAGILITKGFQKKQVTQEAELIYLLRSTKPLTEIIQGCLKYSNNFIANQLFLSSGAKTFGLPASWYKSRQLVRRYLDKLLGEVHDNILIHEGSGISRKNKITASALLTILNRFKQYSSLLQPRDQFLLKSGTLKDVFCYAGYYVKPGSLVPFVLMLNQQKNDRDIILQLLREQLKHD